MVEPMDHVVRNDSALGTADVELFYDTVQPYVDKMGRVAARLGGLGNRDDIVQDALLQAWRSRHQFDPARGSLSAWLLAITAHQATKVRRRLARRLSVEPAAPMGSNLDQNLDLRTALERLSPRERRAVDCYYFADLSVAETAAVMGCSEGTVKSTLSAGRDRLRSLLR